MPARIMQFILALLLLAGLAAIVVPIAAALATDPFPLKWPYSLAFAAIALEKTWAMFAKSRQQHLFAASKDWTTISVGVSYTLAMYSALIGFYGRQGHLPVPVMSAIGFGLYGLALVVRYWAMHHLGRQWAVHLDRGPDIDRQLIQEGPYRWIRHPLYAGACLETVAVALAFNSLTALAVALLLFVPLEIHRAYFEERFLAVTFAQHYQRYASRTWAFIPLPWKPRPRGTTPKGG